MHPTAVFRVFDFEFCDPSAAFSCSLGMRQELVDWMSAQHSSLELADETLHIALRYLDTFLVRRGAPTRHYHLPTI